MKIDIISVVPGLLESPIAHSILKRAEARGLFHVRVIDLRNYSINNNPAAVSYNGSSLPTEFNTATNHNFLGFLMNQSTIEYFYN